MLEHPLAQGLALAAVVSLFLFVATRFVLSGAGRGDLPLASAAIAAGYLAAHYLVLGLPGWPPATGGDKLGYIAAAGLAIGVALDLLRAKLPRAAMPVLCLIGPGLAAGWVGWAGIVAYDLFALIAGMALWVGGAMSFYRLARVRAHDPRSLFPEIMLLAGSLSVAAIASYFAATTPELGRLALALAAALIVVIAANWLAVMRRPDGPAPFGRGALFGTGGALFALVAVLTFETKNEFAHMALLFLAPVFFASMVLGERPRGEGFFARTLRPVFLLLVSLVPVSLVAAAVFALSLLVPV